MKKTVKKAKKISPEEIRFADNTIIEDPLHRKWLIGKRVSTGAFGAVFNVEFHAGKSHLLPPNTDFVIKIEPSENGTLFTENLFFMRAGHPNKVPTDFKGFSFCVFLTNKIVNAWLKETKKKSIGIPHYVMSGVKEIEGVKYRYLIMEKLIESKLQTKGDSDLIRIAAKLIETIQFVHSTGFSHHDIKEDNIMLSNRTDASYLIDFGIATSIKENPMPCTEFAENGTRHFMSRDAYVGMITKRSDIESLFYNLVSWLSGNNLPWKNCKTAKEVQKLKESAFENIPNFVHNLLPTHIYKDNLIDFGNYIKTLTETDQPDYDRLQKILTTDGKVTKKVTTTGRRKIETKRTTSVVIENGNEHMNGGGSSSTSSIAAPVTMNTAIVTTSKTKKPKVQSSSIGGNGYHMVLRQRK